MASVPGGRRRKDEDRVDTDSRGRRRGRAEGPAVTTDGGGGAVELTDEERGERLAQLDSLIELMRPAVQADGGDLALLAPTWSPAWSRSSSRVRAARAP